MEDLLSATKTKFNFYQNIKNKKYRTIKLTITSIATFHSINNYKTLSILERFSVFYPLVCIFDATVLYGVSFQMIN